MTRNTRPESRTARPTIAAIAVEPPHPQRVAQDHHIVVSGNLVLQLEFAAERRLISKEAEES